MNPKQRITAVAPLPLIGTTHLIFQFLARATGGSIIGWYLGLVTYWLTRCTVLPPTLVGWQRIKALVRPEPLRGWGFVLLLIPLLRASLYRLVPGMGYEKHAFRMVVLCASTAFGDGFFKEIFWRGVYMNPCPNRILMRFVCPTIAFALWH